MSRVKGVSKGFNDLAGMMFERWQVTSENKRTIGGAVVWRCVCSCGTDRFVKSASLLSGQSRSCGCLHREQLRARMLGHKMTTTHGQTNSATYRTWNSMLNRCKAKTGKHFKYYAGKGIMVCERWSSFENFLADMGERPKGMTIDRLDSDCGYEPGNCRWADWKTQNRHHIGNRHSADGRLRSNA